VPKYRVKGRPATELCAVALNVGGR